MNGAGAAAIACTELIKAMGVRSDNVIMCDRKGVIYKGRTDLDQWKSAHAVETDKRTLAEALEGADVFLGLSAAGALKPEMVKTMAKEPIIFAMANPDPEIRPPDAKAVRPDAIIATGRSDYPEPGQQRARLPLHLPRRARRARDRDQRRDEDRRRRGARRAGARAGARGSRRGLWRTPHSFGRDYIIPAPFDPRLMEVVAVGGRRGGDAERRRAEADRGHGGLSAGAARAAQPDRPRC